MKTTYSTKEKLSFKLKGLNSFFASLENAISAGNFKEGERIWKLIFEISEEINELDIALIKGKK